MSIGKASGKILMAMKWDVRALARMPNYAPRMGPRTALTAVQEQAKRAKRTSSMGEVELMPHI
jgi:hypothetical protein